MEKIISFSVKHPVSVLMLLFSFIICSLVALKLCPLDYLPEIEDRFLLVSAEYEGLPAEQMKNLVTVPLEDSTASVKGIKKISSITRDGLSLVCLEFRWNVEIETAFSESTLISVINATNNPIWIASRAINAGRFSIINTWADTT